MIPLPAEFLRCLQGHQEVLVTTREGDERGTVPVMFVVAPPGVLYLFTLAFTVKARRLRTSPWVQLRAPGTDCIAEGVAAFVGDGPELEAVAPLVIQRWAMWGATTVEGLRRTVRDGVHVLVRVEGAAPASSRDAPRTAGG